MLSVTRILNDNFHQILLIYTFLQKKSLHKKIQLFLKYLKSLA